MCVTGEDSPDSAAVKQLLHVVEGLEEELFSSEARRNDAEVTPAPFLLQSGFLASKLYCMPALNVLT